MQDYLNQNVHSRNTLFNHLFLLKRILWEWRFWFSTGWYRSPLDESIYHYLSCSCLNYVFNHYTVYWIFCYYYWVTKSWVTCQSKFNVFVSWIWKTCLTDVPWTSLERPMIWPLGHSAFGSCRRPVDVPVYKFWIFVLPVKNRNNYVIQGLLLLKSNFFIKLSVFVLVPWGSPEGPL